MGFWRETAETIAGVASKGIDKIPSDNDRMDKANEVLVNTKEVDLEQIKLGYSPRNNFNPRNLRHWLELVCIVSFTYSCLIVPIVNDIFGTSLQGAGEETINLLWALSGLGGYRLAEKFKR